MTPRLHLVTLGVADLERARNFYGRLGWAEAVVSNEAIAVFDLGGPALVVYERGALAADAGLSPDGTGFRAVTLAHNVASPDAVDRTINHAVGAGGSLVKPAAVASWGGYSGYFADPDGHLWEVAHNPFFPIDADGHLRLSEA